jgi:cell division protein FtsI (penicillin-binding protein 3)
MNELGVKNVRFNGTGLVADQYPEAGSSDLREVVLILEEP